MPPAALLARLDQRLSLLTGGRRTGPTASAPCANTIAWSYDLLSGAEQALFRRLGVFAGGWTLEAAAEVVRAIDEPLDVLEGMAALLDNSLVHGEKQDLEPRYTMLETIQKFGLGAIGCHRRRGRDP